MKRSLSEALQTTPLSADARAFVIAGAPANAVSREATPATASVPAPEAAQPQTAAGPPAPSLDTTSEPHPSPPTASGPVSVTFRLPADLPPVLLRVSMDRKLRRQKPWSQQDILAQALRDWLKRHPT